MPQWVKRLMYNCEDLSLDPQYPGQNRGEECTCHSKDGWVGRQVSLGYLLNRGKDGLKEHA